MKSSKQCRRDAKQLFHSCVVNGVLDEQRVRQAVDQVAASKPRGYIDILNYFQRLIKLDLDRRTAHVESAVPLSPETQSEVTNRLTGIYGQGLQISFGQNPALLGGMRIRVGSDVYDGSVHARLESLQKSF